LKELTLQDYEANSIITGDAGGIGRLKRRLITGLRIMIEKVCFNLLQVAIGNRKTLSVNITDTDWHRLFEFCKRQALVGRRFCDVGIT